MVIDILLRTTAWYNWVKETSASVYTWMGDRISMSFSVDSSSDETLNRGPLALLLWRQYELPFKIIIVLFSIFNFHASTTKNETFS